MLFDIWKNYLFFSQIWHSLFQKKNEKEFVPTRKYCGKVSKIYGLLVIYD